MAVKTDFTSLPIGQAEGNGTIQVCPYCGKRGIKEENSGLVWYIHSETRGYDSEGNPLATWEHCPRP